MPASGSPMDRSAQRGGVVVPCTGCKHITWYTPPYASSAFRARGVRVHMVSRVRQRIALWLVYWVGGGVDMIVPLSAMRRRRFQRGRDGVFGALEDAFGGVSSDVLPGMSRLSAEPASDAAADVAVG